MCHSELVDEETMSSPRLGCDVDVDSSLLSIYNKQ